MPVIFGNKAHLRTLGCLRVEAADVIPLQLNQRPRLLALLAVLAFMRSDGVPRDRLLSLLWPESDAGKARNALNQSVFALRQALGESAIVSEGGSLRLDEHQVSSDVGQLIGAAAGAHDDDVLRFAVGDFLDGVHVVPNGEFERWTDDARRAIRRIVWASLDRSAERARRAGDLAHLVFVLQRQFERAPLDTEIVIALMETLADRNDSVGALAVASSHADRVASELDMAPSEDVIKLEGEIRRAAGRRSNEAVLESGSDPQEERAKYSGPPPHRVKAGLHLQWWRRRIVFGFIFGVVAIVGVATMPMHRLTSDAADGAIAVFPFLVSARDSALTPLSDAISDIIALRLLDQPSPRPVESAALQRALGSSWNTATGTDFQTMSAAARRTQATFMVSGDVTGTREHLVIHARVQRAADGVILGTAEASGPIDSLATLADRISTDIGVITTGVPSWRLSDFRTRSLPALTEYTDGRRHLRDGQVNEAVASFRAALEIDTSFASAALGLAEAGAFSTATNWLGAPWLARAYALRGRLADRDRLLFDALVHDPGTLGTARGELEGWTRIISEMPERAEAWYELGDRYYHVGQRLGIADWRRRARRAFSEALLRDSSLVQARAHLAELMAMSGESDSARQLLLALRSREHGNFSIEYSDWFITAIDATRRGKDASGMPLIGLDRKTLVRIIATSQQLGIALADARTALVALRLHDRDAVGRFGDAALLHHWALNQGDTAVANTALVELQDENAAGHAWSSQWISTDHQRVLDALYWNGSAHQGALAAARIEERGRRRGLSDTLRRVPDRAILALWSIARIDTTQARAYVGDCRRGSKPLVMLTACVAVMEMTHARELRPSVLALDSLLLTGPYTIGSDFAPIILARAWIALGEPTRAIDALERRSNDWVESTAFLYPILELERSASLKAQKDSLTGSLERELSRFRSDVARSP
jgi:DNA-binding SARP family transcriptional activator